MVKLPVSIFNDITFNLEHFIYVLLVHFISNTTNLGGAEMSDFRVPVGPRISPLHISSRPPLGPAQPPIQWVMGALSSRMKRQEREADHSPPTSAEVKKMWIYNPLSHTP
jgi:hypothetical protein